MKLQYTVLAVALGLSLAAKAAEQEPASYKETAKNDFKRAAFYGAGALGMNYLSPRLDEMAGKRDKILNASKEAYSARLAAFKPKELRHNTIIDRFVKIHLPARCASAGQLLKVQLHRGAFWSAVAGIFATCPPAQYITAAVGLGFAAKGAYNAGKARAERLTKES
jgi:hypothetical protein